MIFNFDLVRSIQDLIVELRTGLLQLDLKDNTESFEYTRVIEAGEVVGIRNELSSIPTKYLIVSQEGNGLITKPLTTERQWNIRDLYLTNNGNEAVKCTVIFMR